MQSVDYIDRKLDQFIREKMDMPVMIAKKWQWKILHEYPEELKNVIRQWAINENLSEVNCEGISLGDVINGTGSGILEAVDLLYIISKDPVQGKRIFCESKC